MQEILKQYTLLDYNFGLLGEIYIEPQILYEVDTDFIEKYFSWKDPYFCNRNFHYYLHCIDVGIDEQIMEILIYNGNIPLILIDDNVGTGTSWNI